MEMNLSIDKVKTIHGNFYFCAIVDKDWLIAKSYGPSPEECKERAELIVRLLNEEEEKKRTKSNNKQKNNNSCSTLQE